MIMGRKIRTLHVPGSIHTETDADAPTVIDLFSGCGGLSAGFAMAGFRVIAGFDSWAPAVESYRASLDGNACLLDLSHADEAVREMDRLGIPRTEGIVGGPPCQDFSSAGKRSEGARADLTAQYARIVLARRPSFFLMENVARAKGSKAFATATGMLSEGGYGIITRVLDASLCGVPQKRKRLITIGVSDRSVEDVDGTVGRALDEGLADHPLTMRGRFGSSLGIDRFYRHPRSYARRGIFSMDEPAPTVRGVNRPVPPGYKPHKGDAGPVEGTRALTTTERALVQTLDGFTIVGTKTQMEQQIGNAVPPMLARYAAKAIADSLYPAGGRS